MPPCQCADTSFFYCGDICSLDCPLWEYYYGLCYDEYYAMLKQACEEEYEYYPCPVALITSSEHHTSFFMCPSTKPWLCGDGTCAIVSSDCKTHSECLYNQVQCEDGTCAASYDQCGTVVTCPKSRPFLCRDNTCKENGLDCVDLEKCPSETPFRCPDTARSDGPRSPRPCNRPPQVRRNRSRSR